MKTGRTQKDVGSNFQHLLHFSRGIFKENYIFLGENATIFNTFHSIISFSYKHIIYTCVTTTLFANRIII